MSTTYSYTISTDFSNGAVAPLKLQDQINDSSITSATLEGITIVDEVTCDVTFDQGLSGADKITLDGDTSPPSAGSLIWDHDGVPYPDVTASGYAESDSDQGRTSTSYATKVTLSGIEGNDTAMFDFHWYCEIRSEDSGTRVKVRVRLDDSTVLGETDMNPDTSAGDGYGPVSGFKQLSLSRGTHHVDIDWASSQGGKDVRIRRARIQVRANG